MNLLTPKQEQIVKNFFNSLNEKDKRHFVSVESQLLGHGSKKYLSDLLGISTKTIVRGG
jgi:hypothetical protein